MLSANKGFTLLELAVVFIIIAILLGIGMPYYDQVMERSRMAEATSIIGAMRASQERHMLSKNRYAKYWQLLDATPAELRSADKVNDFFNEDKTIFYTHGGLTTAEQPNIGFAVHFDEINKHWFLVADRVGRGGYSYSFVRDFDDSVAVCVPDSSNDKSVTLCMDAMGANSLEELPPDPRLAAQ